MMPIYTYVHYNLCTKSYQCSVWQFFHLPSQGSNGSFAKLFERLSAAAICLVGASNFGPAAAAPATPAPTALYYMQYLKARGGIILAIERSHIQTGHADSACKHREKKKREIEFKCLSIPE